MGSSGAYGRCSCDEPPATAIHDVCALADEADAAESAAGRASIFLFHTANTQSVVNAGSLQS